jgi:dienelactone hydrolase
MPSMRTSLPVAILRAVVSPCPTDSPTPRRAVAKGLSWLATAALLIASANAEPLAGTEPLHNANDLSTQMVAGIGRYLDREAAAAVAARLERWKAPGLEAEAMRQLLRSRLGMSDPLKRGGLEIVEPFGASPLEHREAGYRVRRVRWPVFEAVWGEGLLLEPTTKSQATIIALSDSDQTPEQIAGLAPGVAPEAQFARGLAEQGCTVLVPVLVDRRTTWSGTPLLERWTNLPHREWIYRQAFEVGRTLIGYEVQKILSALDALACTEASTVGIAGRGEGGLLALHAAALDSRIDATLVSGYFGPHERLATEPIDRNLFRYQRDFGNAELAALIGPRPLFIEPAEVSEWTSPPPVEKGRRACAAPGAIRTIPFVEVEAEVQRAKELRATITLVNSDSALGAFLQPLGIDKLQPSREPLRDPAWDQAASDERQRRTVRALEAHTQNILSKCEFARNAQDLWRKIKPGDEWRTTQADARRQFDEEVIGKLPTNFLPPNARSRVVLEKEKWTAYDVVLDVHADIFAWGVLLLPRDLRPGERRPVVVCQHGLEGVPMDTITDTKPSSAYSAYKAFAAQLADRGFIVFAPHNPYRGKDEFRVLQRQAQPLGWTLFSFINAQHKVITRWLAAHSFVDPTRIAFYGLSYGGKTAMRTPAVVDRYCLSICSGDFNEWVRKNASVEYPGSYLFTHEYEIFEWDLGHTFNYAEMALLIAPRPFMVERGHNDGVATSEWVGYEMGKVLKGYSKLGIQDRAEIEWFEGPHTIHGVQSFEFLHKHLNWPTDN